MDEGPRTEFLGPFISLLHEIPCHIHAIKPMCQSCGCLVAIKVLFNGGTKRIFSGVNASCSKSRDCLQDQIASLLEHEVEIRAISAILKDNPGEASTRVSRATLTLDSPFTYPDRVVRV